jgi:hypothetical protein
MAQSEDSESNSTSFDELPQPQAAQLATIEANRNPHHREVLSFTAFVPLLIYCFAKAPGSGRQLLTGTLSAAPGTGSDQGETLHLLRRIPAFPYGLVRCLADQPNQNCLRTRLLGLEEPITWANRRDTRRSLVPSTS